MTALTLIGEPFPDWEHTLHRAAVNDLAAAVGASAPRSCSAKLFVARDRDMPEFASPRVQTEAIPMKAAVMPIMWQTGASARPLDGEFVHALTPMMPLRARGEDDGSQSSLTVPHAIAWEAPELMGTATARLYRAFVKRAVKYADVILTPTHATARVLHEHYGEDLPIQVMPLAPPSVLLEPVDAAERRERLGLPESYVVTTATDTEQGRLAWIFDAMHADPALPDLVVIDEIDPTSPGDADGAASGNSFSRAGVALGSLIRGRGAKSKRREAGAGVAAGSDGDAAAVEAGAAGSADASAYADDAIAGAGSDSPASADSAAASATGEAVSADGGIVAADGDAVTVAGETAAAETASASSASAGADAFDDSLFVSDPGEPAASSTGGASDDATGDSGATTSASDAPDAGSDASLAYSAHDSIFIDPAELPFASAASDAGAVSDQALDSGAAQPVPAAHAQAGAAVDTHIEPSTAGAVAGTAPEAGADSQHTAGAAIPEDLRDRVHVVRADDLSDVGAVLAGAKLLLQPQAVSGTGYLLLAALAADVPVLYAESAAIAELVLDGGLTAGDATGFAAALSRLMGDADELSRMSVLAGDRGRAFSWDGTAWQLWELHANL